MKTVYTLLIILTATCASQQSACAQNSIYYEAYVASWDSWNAYDDLARTTNSRLIDTGEEFARDARWDASYGYWQGRYSSYNRYRHFASASKNADQAYEYMRVAIEYNYVSWQQAFPALQAVYNAKVKIAKVRDAAFVEWFAMYDWYL